MHHIEVVLVVVSPDPARPGNGKVLLIQGEGGRLGLPSRHMGPGESTVEVASRLLETFTGLKARILGAGWVDLVPLPLADAVDRKVRVSDSYDGEDRSFDRRVIAAPYGAMLPGEVVGLLHEQARWVTLLEAFGTDLYLDHREIIQAACGRV